jgi:hypothetical protein
VRLLVGEGLQGKTWPRPTRRVARLVRLGAANPADSTDLRPALLADSLAPAVRCPTPGLHWVALTSQPAFSELPAAEFTAYLKEGGLTLGLRQHETAGVAATKPGREAYRRCAKTLLLAGALGPVATDTVCRRVLGLPLELVPEQNPYRLALGAALTVRLLRRGQPVAGALVKVWDGGQQPAGYFATHTNQQGRLLLRLTGAGPYLLAAVQLEAAPPTLAAQADWLSTWTSLTFGGPAGPRRPLSRSVK